MAKSLIVAIIGICLLSVGLCIGSMKQTHLVQAGNISNPTYITSVGTNSNYTVGPLSTTRVLATSTARVWAYLTASVASTAPIYCQLDDASSTATGITIFAGQPFKIDSNNLYIGSIQCTAAASSTLYVSAAQ